MTAKQQQFRLMRRLGFKLRKGNSCWAEAGSIRTYAWDHPSGATILLDPEMRPRMKEVVTCAINSAVTKAIRNIEIDVETRFKAERELHKEYMIRKHKL